MAYKLRNREVFTATVDGEEYTITCYTQSTSYGFRHIACEGFSNTENCKDVKRDIVAKATYYNRSYESFRYETVLRKAVYEIAPNKEVGDKLKAIIVDKTAQDEHEKSEQFINSFKAIHDTLTDDNKERLKNMVGENGVTSIEQAQLVKSIATMMSILQ